MGFTADTLGLVADTLQAILPVRNRPPTVTTSLLPSYSSALGTNYLGYSNAYRRNEIVFAAVEMLATSAGEPHIIGWRRRRNHPEIRAEARYLSAVQGLPKHAVTAMLMRNGFIEEVGDHPLIRLLNKPNPFMSRGQLWGTVVMDRCLAGNAYILKARVQNGILKGAVGELWRLRPDRVRIIPSASNYIEGYEYNTGRDKIVYPAGDIMHFKTRDPLDDYYGMPPLMAIAGRIDIDDYMKNFLRTFFERGGVGVGGVLSVKQGLSQEQKDDVRGVLDRRTTGPANWHRTLVLDADAAYTPMGLNRGLRDALPKELDAVQEARIAMAFGIPGSILGLLIGYESSSYANKRQDWQVFWDLTMTPLLSDLDDVLNLSIVSDFGGIDEVAFDLSDIRALQEDIDLIQERHRKNWLSTLESFEEAREGIGKDPNPKSGTFLMQTNMTPLTVGALDGTEPVPQLPAAVEPTTTAVAVINEVHCPYCGRWIGRNMNVGAVAYCPKCKEVPIR